VAGAATDVGGRKGGNVKEMSLRKKDVVQEASSM
jgi:hypothetical protein